jgi:hypothetical protein
VMLVGGLLTAVVSWQIDTRPARVWGTPVTAGAAPRRARP